MQRFGFVFHDIKTLFCRKGDYYRYLAEFKAADEKKEVADLSMKAYEVNQLLVITSICDR